MVSISIISEFARGQEAGSRAADPDFVKQLWKFAKEKDMVIVDA